jgi:hypothetical protein
MSNKFDEWFLKLKEIWESKNPNEIINICADNFVYYESPFEKPYTTKEELLKDWQGILNQDNIHVSVKTISTNNDLGIAQWNAKYEKVPSREKVELSGIFTVRLDNNGRCIEFHMWYNSK